MNLFWDTRKLTQLREDHLTCFVAGALQTDPAFRTEYERAVLKYLPVYGPDHPPRIQQVEIQVPFSSAACRLDLLLTLSDGRRVACEHKVDAPEGFRVQSASEPESQLELYLQLPVDAVAYFRPSLREPSARVLVHPKYLRPLEHPHFLWRTLYAPLRAGNSPITRWLVEGFDRLGYSPPVARIGQLWPDESVEVKANQANFGKLWDRMRAYAAPNWKIQPARRCELILWPRNPGLVTRVGVSPLTQAGTLLRFRVEVLPEKRQEIWQRIVTAAELAGYAVDISDGQLPNGAHIVDAEVSLHALLADAGSADEMEIRLFSHVKQFLDSLNEVA